MDVQLVTALLRYDIEPVGSRYVVIDRSTEDIYPVSCRTREEAHHLIKRLAVLDKQLESGATL